MASSLGPKRIALLEMTQRIRLSAGAVLGIVAGSGAAVVTPWQLAVMIGWAVAALTVTGSIWVFVPRLDAAATSQAAAREDLSRVGDDVVVLVASVISLVGVILALIAAQQHHGALRVALITAAIATVVISWTTVQTIFTLRYARLFYNDPVGGIDFPGGEDPDYLDFAYVAFTIGMTYQVSDTDLSGRAIRHTATRHALLGYVFGTVIIGVTINVVGGLIH